MSISPLPLHDDYDNILLQQLPLLDLRAPQEFSRGAFTNAVNLPLMSDSERAAVGTCYKQQGQQAAMALGYQLVSGQLKQQRVQAWQQFAIRHPHAVMYCARGGLRSQIAQQWLYEAGVTLPRVKGGYKALRRAALDSINQAAKSPIVVVAGATGSGKTRLLKQLNAVDLEALANHRGSAFGRHLSTQPSQINFENALAAALLKQQTQQVPFLLLEDESFLIGQRHIPHTLHQAMQQSPQILLEQPLAERVEIILQDYVIDLHAEAAALHPDQPEQAFELFATTLQQALGRIRKRLGGLRYSELSLLMEQALQVQQNNDDISLHRSWIVLLLNGYYDPMYQYQLEKRATPVLFRGSFTDIVQWWQQQQCPALSKPR